MSTIEKLFVQIFEGKQGIIDQVKQQIDSFDRHFASKLLIEGICPPSWLLNSALHSQTLDPKDLSKEEMIAGLLLPCPQSEVFYSSVHPSLYNNSVAAVNTEQFSDSLLKKKYAAKDGFEAGNGPTAVPCSHVNDVGCAFTGVPKLETTVTSPQDQMEARVSEICLEPDQSLARIQRSKSRQRALELRNSAKGEAKSCLSDKKNAIVDSIGIMEPAFTDVPQLANSAISQDRIDVRISEICNEPDQSLARIQRSKSRQRALELRNSAKGVKSPLSDERNNVVDSCGITGPAFTGVPELRASANSPQEWTDARISEMGDCQCREKSSNTYCGRITRSKSSLKLDSSSAMVKEDGVTLAPSNCVVESLNLDSSSYVAKEDSGTDGKLVQLSQSSSQNKGDVFSQNAPATQISSGRFSSNPRDLELCSASARVHPCKGNVMDKHVGGNTGSQAIFSSEGILNPVKSSNILGHRLTQSRSTCPKKSQTVNSLSRFEGSKVKKALDTEVNAMPCCDIINIVQERHAATAGTAPISDGPVEALFVNAGSRQEGASLRDGVEALFSRPPSNCTVLVKPKQLNFDDVEECNLNNTISPALKRVGQDGSLDMRQLTLLEPVESLIEATSSNYHERCNLLLKKPLLERQEILSTEEESLRGFSETHAEKTDAVEKGNSECDICLVSFSRKTSNACNMSSVKEKSEVHGDAVAHTSPESEKVSEQMSSLICHSPPSCIARRNLLGSPPMKELVSEFSNVDADRKMDFSTGMGTGELDGVDPAKIASEGRLETDTHGSPKKLVGSDFKKGKFSLEGRPASSILDVRRQCTVGDNQDLSHFEDQRDLGNSEEFTFDVKSMQERKSHMGEHVSFSYGSVGSPNNPYLDLISADQTRPLLEGFIMQTENGEPSIVDRISFDELDLPNSATQRACVLEQLCKSVSMHNSLSQFSNAYKLHRKSDLRQSVPNVHLEHMDPRNTLHLNVDSDKQLKSTYNCTNEELNCSFQGSSDSDYLPFSSVQSTWNIRNPDAFPVGKPWEGIALNSGSSEKRTSLNPELTCFPIVEEESGNADEVVETFQEGNGLISMNSVKRELLVDINEECPNPPALDSAAEIFPDRCSLDSLNAEISFTGTHNRVRRKPRHHHSSKGRCTDDAKENQSLSACANGVNRVTESLNNRVSKPKSSGKASLRKKGQSLSERDPKRNNIVSNVTSFIPLVQQKQAAAVFTGKRDIKVKALEAAEAARRLEEKRQNERKMKKEAFMLERARLEQERQLEQKKKKKEEERKKKDNDVAIKKRLREEEERKDKERKRKRIEEALRQQKEEKKLCAEKEEKDTRFQALDERPHERKKIVAETGKHKHMEKGRGEDILEKMPDNEPSTTGLSMSAARKGSFVIEDCDASRKVMSNSDKAIENDSSVNRTNGEPSYQISPFQDSDDEDEEEDDIRSRKFIPSWARKNCLVQDLYSQQKIDPDVIFPPNSFCSIGEVLVPRKQQPK